MGATLCLPEDARPDLRVGAVALIAGSGAETRDGDLDPGWPPGTDGLPAPGTMRRIAHHLAARGLASLRWDRRGFGASGGSAAHADYDSDLEDAIACVRWLQTRPEVDRDRVGVVGHSAGALTACRVCRDVPGVAAACLLGALASPIEDMLRWNLGRVARHWEEFSADQREWLIANLPAQLVRAEGIERYLDAARAGEAMVRMHGHGVVVEMSTARTRQDLHTSYVGEFHHVTCPALVLHGGDDLNVPVADALTTFKALRDAGNDDVELHVLPGLEHYFNPVSPDPAWRVWERVSLEALRRPMAPQALDSLSGWTCRVLG
ncbi:MAG: alpha/beta fold hydrolase [Actinomycetota bacterium]|nr:alpha/beta fold hydrolase [Actinomycetota bacterium]